MSAVADADMALPMAGYGAVFTAPLSIWSHIADPDLSTNEKWGLSAMEVGIAAVSIGIAVFAPEATVLAIGFTAVAWFGSQEITKYCEQS